MQTVSDSGLAAFVSMPSGTRHHEVTLFLGPCRRSDAISLIDSFACRLLQVDARQELEKVRAGNQREPDPKSNRLTRALTGATCGQAAASRARGHDFRAIGAFQSEQG